MKSIWMLSTIIIASLLALGLAFQLSTGNVQAQFTIPTRTPVPGGGGGGGGDNPTSPPPNPTDDNGGGGGGGGGQQPNPTNPPQAPATQPPSGGGGGPVAATNTPQSNIPPATVQSSPTNVPLSSATAVPSLAATATTSVLGSATPVPSLESPAANADAPIISGRPTLEAGEPIVFEDGIAVFVQADECGEPPTILLVGEANGLAGPGDDYESVVLIASGEIRPIIGRAAFGPWWLVQLNAEGDLAWLPDEAGTIHGHTGNVAIVGAPAINGAVPTPGAVWEPTPAPNCEAPLVDAAVAGVDASESGGASANKQAGDEAEVSTSVAQEIVESSTAVPIQLPAQAPATPNLMPIAGLVLVAVAIFVALFLRRSQRTQV